MSFGSLDGCPCISNSTPARLSRRVLAARILQRAKLFRDLSGFSRVFLESFFAGAELHFHLFQGPVHIEQGPALRAGIHLGPEVLECDADLGLESFTPGGRPIFRQPEAFVRELLDESHGLVFGEVAARELASAIFCVFY